MLAPDVTVDREAEAPRYYVRDVDPRAVDQLARELGVSAVTARCLVGRGVRSARDGRRYLEPRLAELRAPQGLAGLSSAVDRLSRAARAGECVGVFGDYDADGVTTAALLTTVFEELGMQVSARVASREAGYGFGLADVEHFASRGCTLVVTGDCGTSDLAALTRAREHGIDTIVVDHHTVPSRGIDEHPATALVNPFCADSEFPFRGMASVGLAFYVSAALRTALRGDGFFDGRPEPDLRAVLDLVAIGTIADLVPLELENRILVREGLRRLARRDRPGLAALLDGAGVGRDSEIDERTVSWKIGPRLNAPGRLGDAQPALDLLLAQTRAVAEQRAVEIEAQNQARREAQDLVLAEVDELLDGAQVASCAVVAGRGWAPGVVGIVAAKLVDRHRLPAVVIAIDPETGEGRGSARSVPGVHLAEALAECSELLERHGGHAGAAGLTIRAENIDAFRQEFAAVLARRPTVTLGARELDAELPLSAVDEVLAHELAELRPCGMGNETPVLLSRDVEISSVRRVGDGSHLKLELAIDATRTISAIAFGMGEREVAAGDRVDLAHTPFISVWRGRARLELSVVDIYSRSSMVPPSLRTSMASAAGMSR